ncbi:hypothetical protein [Gandjariella thermophila]|uniref:Secreted protein n=1 Tax=Gandjariella thermophila TaxID=1931992 RepID=A0A4D4J4D9_9PSEU|nr:hypothetical protein [Gandjariella thermophila]GDY28847.1 hypothetical protein GTS_04800 [Gandjariella thermophila]
MRRLFWLGLGVAAGVAIARKANDVARQATPAGVAGNLGAAIHELASAVGSFGADVRAGMVEREQELYDEVERRTGIAPGGAGRRDWVPGEVVAARPPVRRGTGARARRAGG